MERKYQWNVLTADLPLHCKCGDSVVLSRGVKLSRLIRLMGLSPLQCSQCGRFFREIVFSYRAALLALSHILFALLSYAVAFRWYNYAELVLFFFVCVENFLDTKSGYKYWLFVIAALFVPQPSSYILLLLIAYEGIHIVFTDPALILYRVYSSVYVIQPPALERIPSFDDILVLDEKADFPKEKEENK